MIFKKGYSSTRALIAYTILTLLLTYPAILRIGTYIIGEGDAFSWIGFLYWFDKAIFNLNVNPLYNSYVFYPFGMDIVDSGLIGIILAPITHIFGPIISYNIYVLSTFILAGFGTYLLVKHLTHDEYSSFISGAIFAFSPVHFAHAMGHMHIMSVQWLPFFILYLIKMYESDEKRNIYICSLLFIMNALSSWTMAVLALIFGILFIVYTILKNKDIFNFIKRLVIFTILSVVLILPFLYILIKNMVLNPEMVKPLSEKIYYSADLIGFFIPVPFHPIFGNYTIPIYQKFTGNFSENMVYIGYVTFLFVIYAFLKVKNRYIGLFSISSLIFFILSLGPVLHINGEYRFTEQNLTIMLPNMLLDYIPIFSMIRAQSRISIMLMLSLAVICGYGISDFIKRINDKKRKQILMIAIPLLILVDFAFILPSIDAKYPEFYKYISNDKEDFAILELPMVYSPVAPNSHLPVYHFYQSIHGKKLVGGVYSREGIFFRQFIMNSPLQLFWDFNMTDDIFNYNVNMTMTTVSILNYYNIKYVILHKDLLKESYKNNSYMLMKEIFGDDNYYEDDQIVVYDTQKNDVYLPFIILGDGWYGKETWNLTTTRWMKNNGTLTIVSLEQSHQIMNFTVQPFYRSRTLKIYLNDKLINTSIINGNTSLSIPITVEKGENTLIFYVPEGTDKPSDMVGSEDRRDLSMAFQQASFNTI